MSDATSRTTKRLMPSPKDARFNVPTTSIHRIEADGVQVFYRAAGELNAPVVLLLHGFPASSFMFRELIPRLASDYRVIAPDLPGFGFTEVPGTPVFVHVRSIGVHHRCLHTGTQDRPLRDLRVRLRRAEWFPFGDGSPRADYSDCFAEWERLRRRPW